MPFVEHDVSVDQAAAREMVRRSGQMGVPVITVDNEVIVGFDRRRLEAAIARGASGGARPGGPKLGLMVRDRAGSVEVGGVRPGLLGERAGIQSGDVVESLAGQPIRSVADLERVARTLSAAESFEIGVRRDGQPVRLVTSTEY